MRYLPVARVPNQTFAITLDNQACEISLRQNGANLYMSLRAAGRWIVRTKLCRDRQLMLTGMGYRGFSGEFMFFDQEGTRDPNYTGLGTRYVLVYLSASEL